MIRDALLWTGSAIAGSALLATVAWWPTPAWPQEIVRVQRSTVTIVQAEPPAVAAIEFDNSNQDGDQRLVDTFSMTLRGLTVEITATVGTTSPDRLEVRVPDGYIADPPEVEIRDGSSATIYVYPLLAVGM